MGKLIIVVLVLAVLGGVVFFYGVDDKTSTPVESAENNSDAVSLEVPAGDDASVEEMVVEEGVAEDEATEDEAVVSENVITYTSSGFSPKSITVPVGTKVVFFNESSRNFWPASDVHPTHTVYDGMSLKEHCDNGSEPFDSCGPVSPKEEWSFTFNKAGEWNYHDHTRSQFIGTVVVE